MVEPGYSIILDEKRRMLDWFPSSAEPMLQEGLSFSRKANLPYKQVLAYEGIVWEPFSWAFSNGVLIGILYANWAQQCYLAWRLSDNAKAKTDEIGIASEFLTNGQTSNSTSST